MTDNIDDPLPAVEVEAEAPKPAAAVMATATPTTAAPSTLPSGTASFAKRRLEVIYTLGKDTFDGVRDTITFKNIRMTATISKAGGDYQGALQLQMFGLTMSEMNKMTVLGMAPLSVNKYNTVTVLAATGDAPASVVYKGTVQNAFPDMRGSPSVAFNVVAFGALGAQAQAIPPTSYPGGVAVSVMLAQLAGQMGYGFENHGVSAILENHYEPGTAYDQAASIANAAQCHMAIDNGTMVIWPRGGSRGGSAPIPLLSAKTGMIGYPTFNHVGIDVVTLYNPTIRFGSLIQVESILQPACGQWQVREMTHTLACEVPDGPWFSYLVTCRPGYI